MRFALFGDVWSGLLNRNLPQAGASSFAISSLGQQFCIVVSLRCYTDYGQREGQGQRDQAPEHLLAAAACVGSTSLVQTHFDQGADVNGESGLFGTPLVNAARGEHLLLAHLLLEKAPMSIVHLSKLLKRRCRIRGF